MRRLHLGCHLEDHDLDTTECHCDPHVELTDDGVVIVLHQDITT